ADAQYYYPTLNDTLQIVASTTMGLTLQCARCHSHKYDPIPQVEFYRLQAIFMSALRPQAWIPQMERRVFIASALQKREADEHNARLDTEAKRLTTELDETRERFRIRLLDERLLTLPEPIRDDLRQAVAKKGDERSPVERYLVEKLGSVVAPDPTALAKLLPERYPEFRSDVERHNQSLAALERQRRHLPELRALYDLPGTVSTPLLRRGDPLTPGAPVEPGVLTALAVPEPFAWQPPATSAKTSGRRLAFARWLTQPGHPLTARVMVNRLWLHHFGEGLVGTPEDFGTLGAPPTHPELLDWLAREFVEGGWRLKRLHRLLMTSRVYRQQSLAGSVEQAAAREVDPENRWLWRQRLRRLEAEPLRDAVLAVTGLLDQAMYGTPIPLARRPGGEVTVADGASDRRRAVYLQVSRSNPLTLLHAFDQPVMETNCTRRGRSTVATQALTLLNSDWMQQAAEALADRLTHEAGGAPIAAAVRLAYSRQPLPSELTDFEEFVQRQRSNYATSGADDASAMRRALADLCHMLLSANEFVYVD
ncbi:MAG: DUF1553 domain-containing protein, partial [Planctomycetales bacterium]